MDDSDKKRFVAAMYWLAEKYPVGKGGDLVPRSLTLKWLDDYFRAFRSMPIAKFEEGARYHYAHEAYFPDRPAALRKSCDSVPRPVGGWLPAPDRVLLPETPASQAKENAQKIVEMLNGLQGTSFYVDGEGRVQPSGRRGKVDNAAQHQEGGNHE